MTYPPHLPAGWNYVPIKRAARLRFSSVDKHSLPDEEPTRLCNYVDVYRNEHITSALDFMPATATPSEIARFSLAAGDVLLTKDSETPDDIGVPACITEPLPGVICGYHLAMLRPGPGLDGRFLHRALQAHGIRDQFHAAANGVTRFAIGLGDVGGALIPLPPLDTQRAIADFLDRKTAAIDSIIEKKERLLELAQERFQALLRDLVCGHGLATTVMPSGHAWLGSLPAHWPVLRVKDVARLESGHTPDKGNPDHWRDDNDIPWVSLNDTKALASNDYIDDTALHINALGLQNSSARMLPARVVVFTRDATIGKAAITTRPMAVSQHIIAWVCGPRMLPEYLLRVFYVMEKELVRYTMGATLRTIGMDAVKSLVTPVPPLDEQAEIVRRAESASAEYGALAALLRQQVDRLHEYRQALITAAVTGQLDVTREAG